MAASISAAAAASERPRRAAFSNDWTASAGFSVPLAARITCAARPEGVDPCLAAFRRNGSASAWRAVALG